MSARSAGISSSNLPALGSEFRVSIGRTVSSPDSFRRDLVGGSRRGAGLLPPRYSSRFLLGLAFMLPICQHLRYSGELLARQACKRLPKVSVEKSQIQLPQKFLDRFETPHRAFPPSYHENSVL
jgi:hypothetical protein